MGAGTPYESTHFPTVKGQVMVLYNFVHEFGETPYEKPFVIRFGVT